MLAAHCSLLCHCLLVIPVIMYWVDIKLKGNDVLVQIHVTLFFFYNFHFVLMYVAIDGTLYLQKDFHYK